MCAVQLCCIESSEDRVRLLSALGEIENKIHILFYWPKYDNNRAVLLLGK